MACSTATDYKIEEDFFTSFRFLEEKVLGRGISGEVVLAVSKDNPECQRAIKIFHLHGQDGDSEQQEEDALNLKMFAREVLIMKKFHHPNLMPLITSVRCPNYSVLVLPYCPKGTLAENIPSLDSASTYKYFKQVTKALAYLHSKKVFHGDVKPHNVLINSKDNAVLTDFGMSRMVPNQQVQMVIDCGTKAFRAPETFDGDRVSPFKCDTYALGVTLWCMVLKRKACYTLNYLYELDMSRSRIPSTYRFILEGLLHSDPVKRLKACEVLEDL